MKKRNKVFFALTVAFSVIAIAALIFMLVFGLEVIGIRNNEANDLGVGISAVFLAVISIISAIVAAIASVLSGVFSVLNLKADIKWLKTTSLSCLIFNALTIIAAFVFVFCCLNQG